MRVDPASPISSLIPSLDAAVLEVLAGADRSLGVSQIQRLTRRGARSGVHRVLDRLVTHGLVEARPSNVGSVYRLNAEHVLAPAILLAVRAWAELLSRLTAACEALQPAIVAAALHGAAARGEAGPQSPIELFLVVDDDHLLSAEWDRQLHDLDVQVRAWTGNRLERMVLTRHHLQELADTGEPILEAWRRDAIVLVGRRTFDFPEARA
ncbi:MAG: helix-turn-helix domain-containing protein [Nocardioides sp.]